MSAGIMMREHEVSEKREQARQDERVGLAMQQALESLRGWLAYERSKREEWFEVEDRELYAYHRGYERGIATLEAALKAAGVDLT